MSLVASVFVLDARGVALNYCCTIRRIRKGHAGFVGRLSADCEERGKRCPGSINRQRGCALWWVKADGRRCSLLFVSGAASSVSLVVRFVDRKP